MELPRPPHRGDPVVVAHQRPTHPAGRPPPGPTPHTIRSLPPDTAIGRPPSAPTATALTVPLWPSNGSYSSPLESRSHTRTVASWLPETTIGRVVGERIDIAVLQSSCQPRLQDRGRPPGVQRAIRRAPPLAPTLNRQQCLPGLALAPEDTAGTASRLRPAATRRVRALAVREAVGGLVTPSLCNTLAPVTERVPGHHQQGQLDNWGAATRTCQAVVAVSDARPPRCHPR